MRFPVQSQPAWLQQKESGRCLAEMCLVVSGIRRNDLKQPGNGHMNSPPPKKRGETASDGPITAGKLFGNGRSVGSGSIDSWKVECGR